MTIFRALALLLLLLCQTGLAESGLAQADWNQFRGPTGDGKSQATGLPLTFGENSNVVWKTPIEGKGWSSPVAWGNQIWLTTAPEDGKQMYALCVDFETGEVVRRILVFEQDKPQFCHSMNSYATPTPVLEEGRVYVHFGAHGTACLDTETGKPLWTRRDLRCNHFRGPASSPILHNDLLILHFDGFDLQYVIALNKNTGETVWRTDRGFDYGTDNGDLKKAYCTPTVIQTASGTQLICPAAVATEALDPRDGRLLWTVRHGGMNASARPLFGNGLVYITNGMGQMVVVRPEGQGASKEAGVVWSSGKGVPKKSSMILLEDLLFMISDSGVISCVDAKTGKVEWSKRVSGDFAASPVYVDGRIYFFSREGRIPVLQPGREFKLLAENELASGFMASPAIVGRSFVLRTETRLYRIEAGQSLRD